MLYWCTSVQQPHKQAVVIGITINSAEVGPFEMNGTVVKFNTRVPKDNKMEQCKHIALVDDNLWCPHAVLICTANIEYQMMTVSATALPPEMDLVLCLVATIHSLTTMHNKMASFTLYTNPTVGSVGTANQHTKVKVEPVARIFWWGHDAAKHTGYSRST